MILRARVGGGGRVNSSLVAVEPAVDVRRRLWFFLTLIVGGDMDASAVCGEDPGFEEASQERVWDLLVMAGGGREKDGSRDDKW